ncbi:MAG: flagellar biosynthesis protein FlhF [Hydrogenophaga sp.]|uniref:flagellar biosynthesis protein FlhF n=1 Tax=Hydrogenophaga sp. TaxID=1904254 RepID=UPI00271FB66D|nr:flagellar biosynthesis protein FlhF [Hydrogenophaga sp.]MDO8889596.1 flagellar biosynthesis protein FlhF [Hydrogenophaga sp.]MDO9505742.1 flagellar biosynthesis protein FlhF [Hydrogenophaga sp.]MDP3628638.1 flagellar biosynthesis protein FlhF [Hydrogenophaga sp.]
MNIQRFTAPTSREAMAKARMAFGDSAVILSTRSTSEGFEVMAAAEESLAPLSNNSNAAPAPIATRPAAASTTFAARAKATATQAQPESVEGDTEALAMSTLSFQEYVRERMLRKRRESLQDAAPEEAVAPSPRRAAPVQVAPTPVPAAEPIVVPVQRFNQPVQATFGSRLGQPAIRTREGEPTWEDSQPSVRFASNEDTRMAVELSALKDMIEERFNTLAWLGSSKQNPIQSNLMLKMIRAGYSPAMARAVLDRVPVDAGAPEAFRWLMDVITRNLKVSSPTAGLCDEGGVVSLIGATGVGKTTTAAKLAAQCVKQYGAASVGMITLDTYRVSGYEQLRAYGRMLGVVAHLAHDRAALKDLLNLLSGKRLVIIDTAGLGQRDQRIQDMLDVLDMPKVKKTLVLNAGSHGDTLDETLTSFKASTLHGVVLSKVDEAVKLGPALDALIRHQVTLRGVANGQRVPEDWQNPDASTLVRMSMGTAGKSAYDPVATDMGFYFAPTNARGVNLGASHV